MAKLTEKQKRFVNEYLKDLNGKQAAIRAGYSPKTAEVQAARLLSNAKVQEYLQKRLRDRESRTEITQDRVLKELATVGFSEAHDYTDANIKVGNKIKALELLGKHLGLFEKQQEIGKMEVEDDPLTVSIEEAVKNGTIE